MIRVNQRGEEAEETAEPAEQAQELQPVDDDSPAPGSAARDSDLLAAIKWYGNCVFRRAKDPEADPKCVAERKAWDGIYSRLALYTAAPDKPADPIQYLVDQAQELDMGYGKPDEQEKACGLAESFFREARESGLTIRDILPQLVKRCAELEAEQKAAQPVTVKQKGAIK